MSKRIVVLALVYAFVVPLPGVAQAQERWSLTAWNMSLIADIDRPLAERVFGPTSYGTQTVPSYLDAIPTAKYESYEKFRDDTREGRVDPSARAVLYDPENWDATPLFEKQHPWWALQRFANRAHEYGYIVINTPSRDLMGVEGTGCGGSPYTENFIRCGIAYFAARYADVYEVQAQSLQSDLPAYRAFVAATGAQARKANPNIVFLSGLSTRLAPVTAADLIAAHDAVDDLVDGHYLSVASADPAQVKMARDLLDATP